MNNPRMGRCAKYEIVGQTVLKEKFCFLCAFIAVFASQKSGRRVRQGAQGTQKHYHSKYLSYQLNNYS